MPDADDKRHPRRQYADTRLGQLHLHLWPGPADRDLPPVVCLHPVPYSGRYFATFARELSRHCSVVAVDMPGYGGSDPLPAPVPLDEHALAIADALQAIGLGRFVPLGYHTGSAIAGELAIARPRKVPKAVFVTYPLLDPEERAKQLQGLGRAPLTTEELESLRKRWRFTVHNRAAGVPLERAVDNFVEELRAGENAWFGFHSMFSYQPEERLPKIRQPVLVINIGGSLQAPTAAAAELLDNAHCVDFPDLGKGAFELKARRLAEATAQFLAYEGES